jgi:hypothetical protein
MYARLDIVRIPDEIINQSAAHGVDVLARRVREASRRNQLEVLAMDLFGGDEVRVDESAQTPPLDLD